jgi:hypothetical protein
MKKLIIATAFAVLTLPFTTGPIHAQATTPELSKVDWYNMELIKWKPGKGARAHEIIEMYKKVDKALGFTGVIDFHVSTGEWDSIVAMPMRGGIAQMGWASNPEDKKWDEAFAAQVGGMDKAKAIWEEFDSLIAQRQRHIGHIDRD